ncbi:prolipoprotein diacylglyceryl transferase [Wenjunlia vitaminophila]|uniref:prolipoprotein diacylglyceryl transferase n=1 Tax=Wenjunlia vitaminophila TaxID=76728 RepID=UPI00036DC052|nr:prolipoprotein diacylglyceryl transferase [Wenjunlia vitaminophila]
MDLAYIPSPDRGVIYLGEVPLRGYAFCILLGLFVAIWLGNRRWVARGGLNGTVADVAVWAVPFGLVGARLYHVLTTPEPYFGDGGRPMDAFKIWEGGLGIWGGIALGALGAWIGCRRRGISLAAYADAAAPGVVLAQGVGRWGNWFNQELYGKATDVPWALEISEDKRPADSLDVATYHPTFLYEFLWCVGVALLVLWADRRFRLGHGRAFALYVAGYTAGRFWIEYMRIDDAHEFLGMRLNNWTSVAVFLVAVAALVVSAKKHPGREETVEPAAVAARAAEQAEQAEQAEPAVADRDGDVAGAGTEGTAGGTDGPGGVLVTDEPPADGAAAPTKATLTKATLTKAASTKATPAEVTPAGATPAEAATADTTAKTAPADEGPAGKNPTSGSRAGQRG